MFGLLTLPWRIFAPSTLVRRMGMESMLDVRTRVVLQHCKGYVVDIGCGENLLIQEWKQQGNDGFGIDVYDFRGTPQPLIVEDSSTLPLQDAIADTVTFLATVNHIPSEKRLGAIREAHRLLRRYGRCLVTCLPPWSGFIRHHTAWWDRDHHERFFSHGESHGLTAREIRGLFESTGFRFVWMKRFTLGLNRLYCFSKEDATSGVAVKDIRREVAEGMDQHARRLNQSA